MRIFTISDIHADFQENLMWLEKISQKDFTDDILIVPGDVTDNITLLAKFFKMVESRFRQVFFVPGNHELWVRRSNAPDNAKDSFEKWRLVQTVASEAGIQTKAAQLDSCHIIPMAGWYDYSFGQPGENIRSSWMDFKACIWPDNFDQRDITNYFLQKNEPLINSEQKFTISFSHFVPRIDVMPSFISDYGKSLFPVFGTSLLEKQIRRLMPKVHIYGHSHLNNRVCLDGITYVNNALGYPHETNITSRELLQIGI